MTPEFGSGWETLYPDFRRIAHEVVGRQAVLEPTAVLHEVFVRLSGQPAVAGKGVTFFRACVAQECRRVLVDEARRRGALKRRGSDGQPVTLSTGAWAEDPPTVSLLDLEQAVAALAQQDGRAARVVELRVYGGLTIGEVADALGVAKRTIDGDWAFALAWLRRRLSASREG
jgi:RNA polymerase sigma factor (TIGR02999 family)